MSYGGPCEFCQAPVEAELAAYPVRGWETTREGGGANRILGREREPNRIAHIDCAEAHVRRRRRGVSDDQTGLFA